MTERERFEAWRATVKFPDQVTPWNVWQAALAQQREPVAWLVQYDDETRSGSFVTMSLDDTELYYAEDKEIVPLYTTPTIPEGWMPIETAPKDGTPVDLWRDERLPNMRRVELNPFNVFYEPVISGYTCVRDATHWMPLPSPPAAVKEKP